MMARAIAIRCVVERFAKNRQKRKTTRTNKRLAISKGYMHSPVQVGKGGSLPTLVFGALAEAKHPAPN